MKPEIRHNTTHNELKPFQVKSVAAFPLFISKGHKLMKLKTKSFFSLKCAVTLVNYCLRLRLVIVLICFKLLSDHRRSKENTFNANFQAYLRVKLV